MPSLGHFVLQHAASLNGTRSLGRLAAGGAAPLRRRAVPPALLATRPLLRQAPLFDLRGLAIGNGLTDPILQARLALLLYGGCSTGGSTGRLHCRPAVHA